MANFTIDGIEYRCKKLPARTQAHVARRLTPILDPVFRLLRADGANEEAITAFAKGFADLSDEQLDYVMDHCLAVVQRKQGESWANFMTPDGRGVMFQDVDMTGQLQIIAYVLRDNYHSLVGKCAEIFSRSSIEVAAD